MTEKTESGVTEASLAANRLREEIIEGIVQPGTKLKLVPLSRRYEISRGPLREAALRLSAEGLIQVEEQKGFRVTPISRADLMDITRTRQRIEVLALQDAMKHGDLTWEGKVMASCHILERVTEHDGTPEALKIFAGHHRDFHEILVSACPSGYLLSFREHLYQLTERYRNLAIASYQVAREKRDIAAEHQALAQAAVNRESELACRLLEEHLDKTATALIDFYPELFGEQKDV